MRIFYVGQLYEGGTCLDRMRALQRLGHEVIGFDVSIFQSRYRILRSAQWRWHPRLLLGELNRQLVVAAAAVNPLDCVWIDKGVWIFPETVEQLKARHGAVTVHFTPDAQLLFNRSSLFVAAIPIYDWLVTTKCFEVDLYRGAGAKNIIQSQQSFCPVRYLIPRPESRFAAEVGFIGRFEKSYANHIASIRQISRVWGSGWPAAAIKGQISRDTVQGAGLFGADYVNALASFKIGLGLLCKYFPEQHTTRSFEIPAAGTFLLAERTAEHQEFFTEGEEAEFFGSPEELVSKARFYLDHAAARQRIAARGRERCHRSGYDTDSVLDFILKEIHE